MPHPDPQSLWLRLIDINPIALCFVSSSWHVLFLTAGLPWEDLDVPISGASPGCTVGSPLAAVVWRLFTTTTITQMQFPNGSFGDCSWGGQQWKCMGNSVLKNRVNSGFKAMVIPRQKHRGPRRHLPGPPDQWEIQPNSRNKLSPYPVALVYECIWAPTSSTCEPRRNRWRLGNTGHWFTFHPALSNTFNLPPKNFLQREDLPIYVQNCWILRMANGLILSHSDWDMKEPGWRLLQLFMIFTLFSLQSGLYTKVHGNCCTLYSLNTAFKFGLVDLSLEYLQFTVPPLHI